MSVLEVLDRLIREQHAAHGRGVSLEACAVQQCREDLVVLMGARPAPARAGRPALPTDPEVVERIRRALDDDESPAPWIARAFEALGTAQASAAELERLAAFAHARCPECGCPNGYHVSFPHHNDESGVMCHCSGHGLACHQRIAGREVPDEITECVCGNPFAALPPAVLPTQAPAGQP